jgi:CDP-paratose 2-epimerase
MKILITGGCGFLGSNLAAHALKSGNELVVFENLYREGSVSNLQWLKDHGKFNFVYGDIRNRNDISRTIQETKPDVIFHLAGQVAMTTSIINPRMDFEVNTMGTHNLLEAVRLYAPDAIVIYSSTNKVYGDLKQYQYIETETRYECIDKPNGFDETTPLDFHSPYGCSKGAADQYMLDYARIFDIRIVVFRHSSMYGGRQFSTYDQGWIGWFCQQALAVKEGLLVEPFTISGNGKQVRDVLNAEDVKELYFTTVANIDKAKGRVFNIGGGIENSLSLLELLSFLEELLDVKLNYIKLPPRVSDQYVFIADLTHVKSCFGWKPKVSFNEGIAQMINCVNKSTTTA